MTTHQFDYTRQAWIRDGRYVQCGHPDAMECNCYGKLHRGERPEEVPVPCDDPRCDLCDPPCPTTLDLREAPRDLSARRPIEDTLGERSTILAAGCGMARRHENRARMSRIHAKLFPGS